MDWGMDDSRPMDGLGKWLDVMFGMEAMIVEWIGLFYWVGSLGRGWAVWGRHGLGDGRFGGSHGLVRWMVLWLNGLVRWIVL